MLLQISMCIPVIHLFSFLKGVTMYGCNIACLFISYWTVGLFLFVLIANKATLNVCVRYCLYGHILIEACFHFSLEVLLINEIAG